MSFLNFFLAIAGGNTGSSSGSSGGFIEWISNNMFLIIIAIFAIMIFSSYRKNKRQENEEKQKLEDLRVGDEVTTRGGIIGKVVSIKGETFVLETTRDKTKIRFMKWAVMSIDVKASDIAAQIIEANKNAPAAPAQQKREGTKNPNTSKKKSKKK